MSALGTHEFTAGTSLGLEPPLSPPVVRGPMASAMPVDGGLSELPTPPPAIRPPESAPPAPDPVPAAPPAPAPQAPTAALTDTPPVHPARMVGLDLGPACTQCGGMMQRTGSCYTCSSCGNEARVPFQPRGDKPVYCSDCFQQQRQSSSRSSSRW